MDLKRLIRAYVAEKQMIFDSDMTKKEKRKDLKCLKTNCEYIIEAQPSQLAIVGNLTNENG